MEGFYSLLFSALPKRNFAPSTNHFSCFVITLHLICVGLPGLCKIVVLLARAPVGVISSVTVIKCWEPGFDFMRVAIFASTKESSLFASSDVNVKLDSLGGPPNRSPIPCARTFRPACLVLIFEPLSPRSLLAFCIGFMMTPCLLVTVFEPSACSSIDTPKPPFGVRSSDVDGSSRTNAYVPFLNTFLVFGIISSLLSKFRFGKVGSAPDFQNSCIGSKQQLVEHHLVELLSQSAPWAEWGVLFVNMASDIDPQFRHIYR